MEIKIIEKFLEHNPCYTLKKKIKVKGLMLHSVGCSQPSAEKFIKSWDSKTDAKVCVHAFIDADTGIVYQTLPWEYRAWHCGKSGNNTHIGVEMCEPACIRYTREEIEITNERAAMEAVERTYESAVKLFAFLCTKYNLDPLEEGVIVSHHEGYERRIASNHGDPEHLWKRLETNYTMDGFRHAVDIAMEEKQINAGTVEEEKPIINAMQEEVSAEKISKVKVPEEVTLEEKVPEEVTPEEKVPEEVTPEERVPEEVTPEERVPEEVTPEEKAPVETIPEEKAPVEAMPEKEAPVEAAQVEETPEGEVPVEVIPAEKASVGVTPVEEVPVEAIQAEETPEEKPLVEEMMQEKEKPEETPQEYRMMRISERGIELIKKYEGCYLSAYKCPAGKWTIGYGHTKDVKKGDTLASGEEAEKLLIRDLEIYAGYVNTCIKNHTLAFLPTQNQFDALTSFVYNLGPGNLKKLVQGRDAETIANKIQLYNKGGGKALAGLVKRRREEWELFTE